MTQAALLPSPATTRRSAVRRARSTIAIAVAAALAAGALAAAAPSGSADAATYPSWSDVQAAKASQSAQQAQVTRIQDLIASLGDKVASTRAEAQRAGQAYQDAQTAYDEQNLRQQKLQGQADAASRVAARSESQAGQLAAQLGRSSADSTTTNIFTHPSSAKDLLYQLGAMSKLSEQADGIYEQATQDRGTAQSLADQAKVAEQQLGSLRDAAQQKLSDANAAADTAQSALDAENANETRLQAQLTLLTSSAKNIESNYNKGVAVRKAAAAAKARAAALAAAKAAKAARATTVPNASGWVRPTFGYQTSPFGYRVDPYTHAYALHAGVDLAPGCGSPIYAAASGTVLFAANGGGYGNEVILDNGAGTSTAYGHIVDGGILVTVGQHVSAGQQIARVGSTGWSTGCHLHFETRVNGAAVDPVPFMAARGISV